MNGEAEVSLGRLEKYIYIWMILCGAAGLLVGRLFPQAVRDLNALSR